jgi:hypothetical protein
MYNFFEDSSDSKLVESIILGNRNASYYLINVRYKKVLYGVIGNSLGKHKKFSDDDLEYWLEKFYNYMISPNRIIKSNKFENLKNSNRVKNWLCRCCSLFLIRAVHQQSIQTVSIYDCEHVPTSDIYDDTEAKLSDDRKEYLNRKILRFFSETLSDCDLYIMLTYMLTNNKKIHIVHLDNKIADVLNRCHCRQKYFSGNEVRKIYIRSINKAKKKFSNYIEKYDFIIL